MRLVLECFPPRLRLFLAVSIVVLSGCGGGNKRASEAARNTDVSQVALQEGSWTAFLTLPGGELPFGLTLEKRESWRAWIVNGPEKIAIPVCRVDGESITLSMPHYDSSITARIADDGRALRGEWKKQRSDGVAVIPFRAEYGVPATTTRIETAKLTGRWKVDFSSDSQPAVAIVEKTKDRLWGTFLTTVGDYRYLSVSERGEQVCLSCFDGAHAFLFLARLRSDGKLSGDFWAGGHWHETWIAERDSEAQLPDAFGLTKWQGEALAGLTFPDLDGNDVSLVDRRFAGKVRIIHIFGSWCPNCQDAGKLMTELHGRYSSEGLSVLGLAFELTDDRKRSARQLRLYRQRHHALYPILIAGLSDKAKASKKLPILDRVRSFPTTIFLHRDGRIRAVHTGFAGPATGAEHERLKAKFESIVRELIAESPTG